MANSEFMQPHVKAWMEELQAAREKKAPFKEVAGQCMDFFSSAAGAMWDQNWFQRYVGGNVQPRFKLQIAKAFELVALYGPTLFWRNPHRVVKPREAIEMPYQELFAPPPGMDPNDPQAQQQMQQMQQMAMQAMSGRQQSQMRKKIISGLYYGWLNYTPREQSFGGLAGHSSKSVTEALVKGRGVVWPKPYMKPSSERLLTGAFYDSVDNLLIDPYATGLDDAGWIAQECTEATGEVERKYKLPEGSLRGAGTYEAMDEYGRHRWDADQRERPYTSNRKDRITYWKIWSKVGVGGRLGKYSRPGEPLSKLLDEKVGNYAHIVVCEDVPWPLNCPAETILKGYDDDIVKRLGWPIPYWLDDRWPCAMLDFYYKPGSPWPIAPMAPGLGELMFLNVMMSHLCNKIWWTQRTILAYDSRVSMEVEKAISHGKDLVSIKVNNSDGRALDTLVNFIEMPNTKQDVWAIIAAVMDLFDKRVGLSELLYGLNPGGVQIRTSEAVATQREMTSIRPEYMAGKVEDWMSDVADMEKLCTRWFVESKDVQGLMDPFAVQLWEQYITGGDPEESIRGFEATVEANSVRRPDKTRDIENINQLIQLTMPFIQQWVGNTGDPTPWNALVQKWGKVVHEDVEEMMLQAPPPPPQDPAAQEAMQLQLQQMQMEMEQMGMKFEAQQQQSQQTHEQRQQQSWEQHQQRLAQGEQTQQQRMQQQRVQQLFGGIDFRQGLRHDEESHDQDMRQAEEKNRVQIALAKKAQKPKPKPAAASRNGKAA